MNFAQIRSRVVLLLLCLAASASQAATHPLNFPRGLAVDAKGNLYVANTGGNQILVYNPSGQQMTAKTITTNINSPMQPTFDPQGNLWVANIVPASDQEYFTEYGPNGKQINTAYTANSNRLSFNPGAFAVDGAGNLWISGIDPQVYFALMVQNGPSPYNGGGIVDSYFEIRGDQYTAVAARGPWIAVGAFTGFSYSVSWEQAGSLLGGNPDHASLGSSGNAENGVIAMTFDNNSNLYYATAENFGVSGVWFVNLATGAAPVLPINVGYFIYGLAVDSVHGRLYISNARANSIAVYSTSTWLQIATIQ